MFNDHKTSMVNKIVNYQRLSEYLKKSSKGYQPKRSKNLPGEDILTFIEEACF